MSKSFLARVGRTYRPTQVTAILLLLKLPPEVQKEAEQAAAKLQTEITTALDRIDNQMRASLQKVGKAADFKEARKEFRDAMVKWMADLSHKAETRAEAAKTKDEGEWTDEIKAMRMALRLINTQLLTHSNLEETAKADALFVKKHLDTFTKGQLIDHLTQAVIDHPGEGAVSEYAV